MVSDNSRPSLVKRIAGVMCDHQMGGHLSCTSCNAEAYRKVGAVGGEGRVEHAAVTLMRLEGFDSGPTNTTYLFAVELLEELDAYLPATEETSRPE